MTFSAKQTDLIRREALELGFLDCKFSKAQVLDKEAKILEAWLNQNLHGQMSYMQDHFDLRIDPSLLLPSAKSIIVVSQNYYTQEEQEDQLAPKISKYAYGKDYHKVIRKKLKTLVANLKVSIGDFESRICIDSAPIMEKAWAVRSGLGWQGKNANILTKKTGSFYFIGIIITDLDLVPDGPVKDYCGSCTKCIDACPTQAIYEAYKVDATKCISYLTIELKEKNLPDSFQGKMENWAFGCDICQDVCPINARHPEHNESAFKPKPGLLNMKKEEWEMLEKDQFEILFEGSPVKRAKFEGLKRNIDFLKKT